jgi:hypothetical protein
MQQSKTLHNLQKANETFTFFTLQQFAFLFFFFDSVAKHDPKYRVDKLIRCDLSEMLSSKYDSKNFDENPIMDSDLFYLCCHSHQFH